MLLKYSTIDLSTGCRKEMEIRHIILKKPWLEIVLQVNKTILF